MKILIKNGRVWDGTQFISADILTEDKLIAKIAPDIQDQAQFVYDAQGKLVTPGLVDAHVHMAGIEPDLYGINAEMSALPFGVTAVADAGGAHANREIAAACQVKNLTFVTASIQDDRADFTTTEKKLALYGDRAIGLKVYFDTSSKQVRTIAPLQTVCAYAQARGLKVMVHCSHSPVPMAEILETLAPGDILTHAYHGGENNAAEDGFAAIKKAKQRGVVIDAGFAGHIHTDFAVFKAAVAAGALPDTISTDITRASAYKRGGRYGMTMCMSMAKHLGMGESDILRAVTTTPAKVLGKAAEWGSLKVGAVADIAVFDYTNEPFSLTDQAGNHIESDMGYRCLLTISDGQVVYRH